MLGMASALETLCGQAFGAKSYQMLGIYLQRSWIVLSIFAVLFLPLFIFTGPILKRTGQSEAVADRTEQDWWLSGWRMSTTGMAVGCGWKALATIVNLGSYYVVGLPLGIIFGWLFPFGIKGIWSGLIGGTVVQTLLQGLITLKCDWQEKVKKAKNLAMEASGFGRRNDWIMIAIVPVTCVWFSGHNLFSKPTSW